MRFISFLCIIFKKKMKPKISKEQKQKQSRPPNMERSRSTKSKEDNIYINGSPLAPKEVYPRVKVKEQEKDNQSGTQDYKINSVLSLKDVLFLSMLDSCFPAKRHQDVPAMPTARIPESYVPLLEKPEEAEKNKKEKTDGEDRPNIRVSSTPRPRALISSPDNDAVFRNKNRNKEEHGTALKNHNMVQNRHTTRTHIFARSPVKPRKSKDDAECNSETKGTKGSGATTVSSQRRRHRIPERPSWQDP